MATWLKQSTPVTLTIGPFVDQYDGFSPKTALTIAPADVRVKRQGAAWSGRNLAGNLTHEETGWYSLALDGTDTNTLGSLVVAIYKAGALPVWREFQVVPAAVYDAMVSPGTSPLAVNATQIAGASAMTQIRDAVFNGVIENSKTFVQLMRGMVAALMGKSSGLDGTNPKYRDNADSKDRINATVDEFGNRSAITTDLD